MNSEWCVEHPASRGYSYVYMVSVCVCGGGGGGGMCVPQSYAPVPNPIQGGPELTERSIQSIFRTLL